MYNESSDVNANTRDAVAVLTAWLSESGKFELALDLAEEILAEENGARRLCSGLISIAGKLLIEREAQGEDPNEILQKFGLDHA